MGDHRNIPPPSTPQSLPPTGLLPLQLRIHVVHIPLHRLTMEAPLECESLLDIAGIEHPRSRDLAVEVLHMLVEPHQRGSLLVTDHEIRVHHIGIPITEYVTHARNWHNV